MNTHPESEEFQQVRRWLALKRYEQPPPGYFDGFSRRVMVRIQALETQPQASWLDRLQGQIPWLQRLWDTVDARPMLAGAFGMTVCGMLAGGLFYSYHVEPAAADQLAAMPADGSVFFPQSSATAAVIADRSVGVRPADLPVDLIPAKEVSNDALSDPSASLFAPGPPGIQRASFALPPK